MSFAAASRKDEGRDREGEPSAERADYDGAGPDAEELAYGDMQEHAMRRELRAAAPAAGEPNPSAPSAADADRKGTSDAEPSAESGATTDGAEVHEADSPTTAPQADAAQQPGVLAADDAAPAASDAAPAGTTDAAPSGAVAAAKDGEPISDEQADELGVEVAPASAASADGVGDAGPEPSAGGDKVASSGNGGGDHVAVGDKADAQGGAVGANAVNESAGPPAAALAAELPAPAPAPHAAPRATAAAVHDAEAGISEAMAAERATIASQMAAQRGEAESNAAAQESAVLGGGLTHHAQLLEDFTQRENGARAAFAVLRANVTIIYSTQSALARADAEGAARRLREDAGKQQVAVDAAAETEGNRMRGSAKQHGVRIVSSGSATSRALHGPVNDSIAAAEAIEDGGDREAVKSAIRKAHNKTRDKLLDDSLASHDKLQTQADKNHKELQKQAGKAFTKRDKDLPKLEAAITETGDKLAYRFFHAMLAQLAAISEAERKYIGELRQLRVRAGGVLVASREAASKIRQRGQLHVATIAARELGATAQIDGIGNAAIAELAKHERLPRSRARKIGAAVKGELAKAREQQLAGAADAHGKETATIAGAPGNFSAAVEGKRGELGTQIDGGLGQVVSSINDANAQLNGQFALDRATALTGYTSMQVQFSSESWGKVDELRTDWRNQADHFETTSGGRANDIVAKHGQLLEQMPAKLEGVEKSTIKERHKSRLRRLLEGAWKGFLKFLVGLAIVIALIGLAIILEISIAVVLAIAAVVMLCLALYERFKVLFDAWDDWSLGAKILGVVGTVFAAVGDVFGFTNFVEGIFGSEAVTGRELSDEERAERFTVGALTLATLGLARLFKFGRGAGPRELGEGGGEGQLGEGGGEGAGETTSSESAGSEGTTDSTARETAGDTTAHESSDVEGRAAETEGAASEGAAGETTAGEEPTSDEGRGEQSTRDEPQRTSTDEPQQDTANQQRPRALQPADVDAAMAEIRASGRVTGDIALLEQKANEARRGDQGALGEIEAVLRWIREGSDVEVLPERQNAEVRNPDYRVNGRIREVKTETEAQGTRTIRRKIEDANNQIRRSGLTDASGNPETGGVEIQLNGEMAETPLDVIESEVRRQFTSDRSRSLDTVRVYRDGELAGEWVREPDGRIRRRFPPGDALPPGNPRRPDGDTE